MKRRAWMLLTVVAACGDGGSVSDDDDDDVVVAIDADTSGADSGGGGGGDSLYGGPVGGALPGWDSDAPIPLVMLGRQTGSQDWLMTLASIAEDGTIGDNVADRIIIWGWPSGGPSERYDGPVDASAALSSWDPPEPLVMGGALGTLWFATLARIDADGSLHENVSNRLLVWGF